MLCEWYQYSYLTLKEKSLYAGKQNRKVATTADNCTPHLSSVTTIRFSDFNLPVTLMGMTHEVMTWELLFILSSGVGSGRALDQLVCLSRVEGMLGMGNLDR